MKLFNHFIIEPKNGEKFISKQIIGGVEMFVNTSIEHAKFVNREAIVLELPIDYVGIIQKGDTVIVSHNVFRTYLDMQGKVNESDNLLEDNKFKVVEDEIFLIIRNGEYIAVDKYCFVEPIEEEVFFIGKREIPQVGIMKHCNSFLKSQGVKEGDTIIFDEDSEYEFMIDNKKLYRMYNNSILGILN